MPQGRIFPPVWERANVVLIPKGGRPAGTPSAYRPICLLDEIGKIFERIIVGRLVQHLKEVGPDLHEEQFGFREGRSTTDAILRVRSLAESSMEGSRVLVAVSLDITNAFNTLPWGKVGDALTHHGVPQYLVEVVKSYFRSRGLGYRDKSGAQRQREMYCGVPHGSVLGPLLWDIAYDCIIQTALPTAAMSSVMRTTHYYWPGEWTREKQ
ncbi:reverse transcriptase [Lasius niger]|uniref:Reverse transcriptase n=1 Tax=Lasius niger TaxID=67767 RepID=A0A0J7KED5_LASNI|nr:reverse transcriptase [Lasius niger]